MKSLLALALLAVLGSLANAQSKDDQKITGLLAQLKSPDLKMRLSAAVELGRVGQQAKQKVIPALLEVVLDSAENFNVHNHAVNALKSMGQEAAPALIQSLEKGTTFVRRVSARALGAMGKRQFRH